MPSSPLSFFFLFFYVQHTFSGGFAPAPLSNVPKSCAKIGAIAGSASAVEALMHVTSILQLAVGLHQEGGCAGLKFQLFFAPCCSFILCRYNHWCTIYAPHLSACNSLTRRGGFAVECNLTKEARYAKKPHSTLSAFWICHIKSWYNSWFVVHLRTWDLMLQLWSQQLANEAGKFRQTFCHYYCKFCPSWYYGMYSTYVRMFLCW